MKGVTSRANSAFDCTHRAAQTEMTEEAIMAIMVLYFSTSGVPLKAIRNEFGPRTGFMSSSVD